MSTFRVIASTLNVRSGPSTQDLILTTLARGTVVEPQDLSQDEKWYRVEVPQHGELIRGWVYKDFLVPEDTDANTPKWLEIAEGEIGEKEVPGPGNNPRIIEYHRATTLKATEDAVAWCSSFVNFCMKEAGIQGTKSAAARSWQTWGNTLAQPRKGAIAVLKRGPNPAKGHVAFFIRETVSHISLLGGNQSDQVKISEFPKSMLLTYRWPIGIL